MYTLNTEQLKLYPEFPEELYKETGSALLSFLRINKRTFTQEDII